MPANTMTAILEWIEEFKCNTLVTIKKTSLADSNYWFYDNLHGEIRNQTNSFFKIKGFYTENSTHGFVEQPIIIQNEIGILGIIRCAINGELHYLMQAKIEPGNINKIQVAPTLQATRSNFTQKHGGNKPAYLDYFLNAMDYTIVFDQIQSEQSSRFYKKRNRNIIIEINEVFKPLPNFMWITMNQIKELMRLDNVINMDARTVLSCIPVSDIILTSSNHYKNTTKRLDESLFRSMHGNPERNYLSNIMYYINNYKMFDESEHQLVPLFSLKTWSMRNNEFVCDTPYPFKVVFCDIEIEGREVRNWDQPLFEATGIATFGLITCIDNGIREFLVRALPEIGCFDKIELAPTIQREAFVNVDRNCIDAVFDDHLSKSNGVCFDALLSEEGGRFFREQNRNIVININKEELQTLPQGYFWVDYRTLNMFVQSNNYLNIQLRNLLSVLEW